MPVWLNQSSVVDREGCAHRREAVGKISTLLLVATAILEDHQMYPITHFYTFIVCVRTVVILPSSLLTSPNPDTGSGSEAVDYAGQHRECLWLAEGWPLPRLSKGFLGDAIELRVVLPVPLRSFCNALLNSFPNPRPSSNRLVIAPLSCCAGH